MPKRKIVRPSSSVRKHFSNTANRVHKKNVQTNVQRGGIRL